MHNEVKVEVKGHTLSGRVDPFTGLLFSKDFSHNLRMPSIIKDDYVINYGFYDAGPGYLGMSARNQFYVHVTPNHSNWIGALLKQYRGRFTVGDLVLPSSHDSGMYLDLPLSVDLTARGFVFTSGQMVSSLLAFIPVVNLLAPIVSMLSTTAALLVASLLAGVLGPSSGDNRLMRCGVVDRWRERRPAVAPVVVLDQPGRRRTGSDTWVGSLDGCRKRSCGHSLGRRILGHHHRTDGFKRRRNIRHLVDVDQR